MTRSLAISLLCLGTLTAPGLGQIEPFTPSKSVWSVHSSDEIPNEAPASAEELAPGFQLLPLGRDEQGFETWKHEPSGMLFVFVPGGKVTIGSDYNAAKVVTGKMASEVLPAEQPSVEIYVSPFFIGLYEVTNKQYEPFLEAYRQGGVVEHEYLLNAKPQLHTPLLWDQPELGFREEDQPVAGVSWISAWAMSSWLGGRLPTDAEWEKACRGTDSRLYPWGNHWDHTRANTHGSNNAKTTPVGLYPGGRSPYGCYDMIGNVTEYTADAFEKGVYRYYPVKDPCLLFRNGRKVRKTAVSRGGCWNSLQGAYVYTRAAARCREYTYRWIGGIIDPASLLWSGFRIVLSPLGKLHPESWLEERRATIEAEREK